MGYMKHFKCPTCHSTESVTRQRKRGTSIVFLCNTCEKYFSINTHWMNRKELLSDHLDGLSFRKLAVKYNISKSQAWDICHEELSKLPNNNQFTYKYCEKFSKVFLFDGKYFNIASEKHDWALLWGIDYFRHDIPVYTIAPRETYQTWGRYFSFLRILNLHPKLLVCDDHTGLKLAARSCFPGARVQTCYNHFKENIRRDLHVRSEEGKQYEDFMKRIESILDSSEKISDENFNHWLFSLFRDYKQDPLCVSILTNIERYKGELLAYRGIPQAPLTNNLIEGVNGHLEARLHSLRSFQTIQHARLWMNGYVLKRRQTKFTDCRGKFRFLNGKTGVQMTKKERVTVPLYF